jgi:Zn-dependent M28 family amino/carboxypeptidase
MKEIGLEPAFSGNYLQKVPLAEVTSILPSELSFRVGNRSKTFESSKQFVIWSPLLKEKVTIQNSELIFAGYGIDSPDFGWNDFEGIDLKGKTIVVLVNDPGFHTGNSNLFKGKAMTYYGRWSYKYSEANSKGATACIIIHEDAAAGYPWSVVDCGPIKKEFYINNTDLRSRTCMANGWITQDAGKELFAFCGMDYEKMKQMASLPGFKPVSMGAKYSTTILNSWKEADSYNVGGIIKGAETPEEVLVYTAHWDHLGIGIPINGDSIYNGASDNAAAVAWMLSIAKAFKVMDSPPKRSILFLSPSVEEAGMIGSQYYVENPVFPLSKTVACFNSDVILFLGKFKDVTITGMGHSDLDSMLNEEAAKQGRYICNDPNPENGMFFRSDQMPFLKGGVPSLFAKGYSDQVDMGRDATLKAVEEYWRTTYHKPSDHYIPGTHNLDGLIDDTKLFFNLGLRIANSNYYPKWSKNSEFFVER